MLRAVGRPFDENLSRKKTRMNAILFMLVMAFSSSALAQVPLRGEQVLNQASSFSLVTPSDSLKFRGPTKGVYIGDAGACDVALVGAQDLSPVLFTNIATGVTLPLSIIQVMATDTTCTSIIGLW
jgi:hypothetical protein